MPLLPPINNDSPYSHLSIVSFCHTSSSGQSLRLDGILTLYIDHGNKIQNALFHATTDLPQVTVKLWLPPPPHVATSTNAKKLSHPSSTPLHIRCCQGSPATASPQTESFEIWKTILPSRGGGHFPKTCSRVCFVVALARTNQHCVDLTQVPILPVRAWPVFSWSKREARRFLDRATVGSPIQYRDYPPIVLVMISHAFTRT